MQNLKRLLFTLFIMTCATLYGLYGDPANARTANPPAARTGAPPLGTNNAEPNCTACHTTNLLNSPGGTFSISAPDSYAPGTNVTVTVNIARGELVKFGFQLTALDEQGNKAGELVLTNAARTQLLTAGTRQYVAHTAAGTAATETGKSTWTFTWQPPAQAVGRVTFYASGIATNNNNTNAGDFVYTASKAIDPPGSTVQSVVSVSAASYARVAASESIQALFGSNLATTTVAASTIPLPTTLGNVRVVVQDLTTQIEHSAPLFFVSPQQINFLIPAGVTNGMANVSVLRDNVLFARGEITVTSVAPALFTFNANGQGVPAAVAVRVKGTAQTIEAIARLNGTTYEATPIDLGAEDEMVFLSVFGTGFRNRGAGGTLSATIGGTNSTNVAAAAQSEFVGLDQANILIPRSLIGRGSANVILTVNGQPTNTVQINVK